MAGPKTRAGSGLTVRKNSAEVLSENVQDLDFIEGAGVQLTLEFDRAEAAAKLTITPTGVSSDVHVEVTAADTNPSGLNDKLGVTAPISKVTENAGGDELLRLSHGGQHDMSDLLGVISAAQHGTQTGDLHPDYETSAEAQAKVDTHAAAADPHPVYETSAEAAAKVTAHEGAADPHAGYQKESEKGAASGYAGLDAGSKVPVAQLGSGTPDGTKFLRDDQTYQTPPGGGSPPTGTGFRHVTGGVEDAAAKLVDTADINNSQVTYAKMQDVSVAARLLGRAAVGSAAVQEIAPGTGLQILGTNLSVKVADLWSIHNYVFVPDAAPQQAVIAGDQQGAIHHSGPTAEKAVRLYVDAETAPGASGLPITVQFGDTDDLDTVSSWTTIATLTLSSVKSDKQDAPATETIPANRLIRMNVGTIVGAPKDVTISLRVQRPLVTT